MKRMNLYRLLTASLVAGLALNFGYFLLNSIVLKQDRQIFLTEMNVPRTDAATIVFFNLMPFPAGFVLVLLYSLMKSVSASRILVVLMITTLTWFVVWIQCFTGMALLFRIPVYMIIISLIGGWPVTFGAANCGALLYRDLPDPEN